jgi:flagellar motor component MotA
MNRDEFVKQYTAFLKHVLPIAAKARRESLLGLSGDIDHQKADERDIFHYGLRFAVNAYDSGFISVVLENIVKQEKDEYTRLYKTIQSQAVFGIHQGHSANVMYYLLNSLTDIPLTQDEIYSIVKSYEEKLT